MATKKMIDRLFDDAGTPKGTDLDYPASLYAIAVSTPDGDRIGFVKFEE